MANKQNMILKILDQSYERITRETDLGHVDKLETREQKKRDANYSQLLSTYAEEIAEKRKTNKIYKHFIFWTSLSLFVLVALASIIMVILAIIKTNLANVLVGSVSLLSTMLTMPKMLIQYLFPIDEQLSNAKLIEIMQNNDLENKRLLHTSEIKCIQCESTKLNNEGIIKRNINEESE